MNSQRDPADCRPGEWGPSRRLLDRLYGSGVVFLPAERAGEVISAAEVIAKRESEILRRIEGGESLAELLGRSYKGMLEGRTGT